MRWTARAGGGGLVVAGLALVVAACGARVTPPVPGKGLPAVGFGGGSGLDAIVLPEQSMCLDPTWACWSMPNPAATGLPNPASYLTQPREYVWDAVTNMRWQWAVVAETPQWQRAKELCAGLLLGSGFERWRLPTRIELVSLVDFTRTSPAIDGAVFPGTVGSFWTSSPVPGGSGPAGAWQVAFASGGAPVVASQTSPGGVRCVASQGPPGQDFARYNIGVFNGDETVTDLGTRLMWRRAPLDATYTFAAAQLQCGAAGFGWRVPSVKELQTLVDEEKTAAPFIDEQAFSGTPAGSAPFWTSSRSADTPNAAWFVDFGTGAAADAAPVAGNVIDQLYQVRCVR